MYDEDDTDVLTPDDKEKIIERINRENAEKNKNKDKESDKEEK